MKIPGRLSAKMNNHVDFFKSQMPFWLIGAADGNGKNVSVFLKPEGRSSLTPFYDVLSAQPGFDKRQITNIKYKLTMSVGKSPRYRILEVIGRHFVQTGKAAGLGPTLIIKAITDILERTEDAPDKTHAQIPEDFAREMHDSIVANLPARLRLLETAFDGLSPQSIFAFIDQARG